jgi:hypothetical protein
MTFPTYGKLDIKIVVKLLKIAENEEIKDLRIQLRFLRDPKKLKKALDTMKRLR